MSWNKADSWEVEFKDPKQPPSYVTTGNNEPILGEVKFRAPTLLGDARRTLRIPCASQSPLTLGEVVGELLDVADAEPELGDQKVGNSAGQGDVGGGPDHLSLESSFRSGSSLEEDEGSRPPSGNGAVLADSSTESVGFSGEFRVKGTSTADQDCTAQLSHKNQRGLRAGRKELGQIQQVR